MMFDRIVYEVTSPYRIANNAMYVVALLLGAYFSFRLSFVDIRTPQNGNEPLFFMLLFSSVVVLYTPIYFIILMKINAFGEKYRANLFTQLSYEQSLLLDEIGEEYVEGI